MSLQYLVAIVAQQLTDGIQIYADEAGNRISGEAIVIGGRDAMYAAKIAS